MLLTLSECSRNFRWKFIMKCKNYTKKWRKWGGPCGSYTTHRVPGRRWCFPLTEEILSRCWNQSRPTRIQAYNASKELTGQERRSLRKHQGKVPYAHKASTVTPANEVMLKKSFKLLLNNDRIDKKNEHVLLKVAVTKVPLLDKVMAVHCLKSIKSYEWTLSRIQALTLDTLIGSFNWHHGHSWSCLIMMLKKYPQTRWL